MALLIGQALPCITSFDTVDYLPAAVSCVTVAMLWIRVFNGESGIVNYHWLMAASVTVLLPGLIIFFFFQKTFVQGVVMSGIKG